MISSDLLQKFGIPTWKPFNYHPVQAQLWQNDSPFEEVVAGRGSGKTEICRRRMILDMAINKPWPDPLYFYVLPTFQQAKRAAWKPFLRDIPKNWYHERFGINRQDLCITLYNGAMLYIAGADKPERLEGVQADWVMVDEGCDQKPGLIDSTILPMLTRKNGRLTRLGKPKRSGVGRADFRKSYEKGLRGEGGIRSFHWKTIETLFSEEEKRKHALAKERCDPQTYKEEYEAEWLDVGGGVYYAFTPDNISFEVHYDPAREIVVGCDFNVNPMCWTLGHFCENGKLYVFDEIFLRDTNTQSTLDYLHQNYRYHMAGWKFIGDASARSRKTSATRSDYLIIKNDMRFGRKKVFFPERNPHLRDRFASVNAAFRTASGEINCYIHPKCEHLVSDLNAVAYIEKTMDVEDYSGTNIGHMSDAFGYKVHMLMPLRLSMEEVPAVWSAAG